MSIPELGTVRATQLPMVFLTSNNTRELSEALKRRCLYLHIDYPDLDREREIVRTKVPGISEELADQVARIVRSLRTLELRKAPSVSETLDWARTLVLLGVETIDAAGAKDTLHVLLKYQADIERAHQGAAVGLVRLSSACSTFSPASSPSCAAPGCRSPLTEHLDAAEAVKHIPLEDREALKYALAATLVKSSSHWRAFETAFEVFFARAHRRRVGCRRATKAVSEGAERHGEQCRAGRRAGQGRGWQGGGRVRAMTPEELAEMLFRSLLSADAALMNAVARDAVDRYAGMEPGRPVGGTYYLYRTLRNLDLDGVLERLMGAGPGGRGRRLPDGAGGATGGGRVQGARSRSSGAPSRPRSAAVWSKTGGAEALARSVRKPLPEDIDVMHATREELALLHRVLHPLSRKLAVRLARKRRARPQGPPRLPGHHAALPVDRWRAH